MKRIAYLAIITIAVPVLLHARTVQLEQDKRFSIRNSYVTMRGGTKATLHSNGKIKSGYLAQPLRFKIGKKNTVLLGTKRSVIFHSNGRLSGGYIQGSIRLNTRYGRFSVPDMGWISFHKNGRFSRIDLMGTARLKGMPGNSTIRIRKFIIFNKRGTPKSVYLSTRDQKINGYLFKGGSNVEFHTTGHVARGVLAKNVTKRTGRLRLKKKRYQAGKSYTFDTRGKIK